MDAWPQDQHRHKRTFDQMSQHASLSPSPFFFGHPMPSLPLDNRPAFWERRHQPSQSTSNTQDNMSEPRVHSRPSLEHRASQTIIDLTDDAAGEPVMGNTSTRFMSRPPQQPGRSNGLGFADFIDLTRDVVDDEVEIINTRRVAGAQQTTPAHNRHEHRSNPLPRLRLVREDSPSMFFPEHLPHPMHHNHNVPPDAIRGNPMGRLVGIAGPVNYGQPWGPEERISLFVVGNGNQRMPEHLDYAGQPFASLRQAYQAQHKPQHQPPPPAKPGFTRSPKEDDVAVCPGCLKELVAEKGNDEPVVIKKPGAKTPSKKDREEHHFWVIKECGHVYCNRCYKGRKSDKKEPSNFSKKTILSGKTVPICAVDGCNQDVGEKRHWVGVFI